MIVVYSHPARDDPGVKFALPVRLPDCLELGPELPDQSDVACAQKLRSCALHVVCTTGVPRDGVACCATCPDHTARL